MINDVLDDALNKVQKESDNPNTVSVACINLMTDIKKIYLNQQENLKKLKKKSKNRKKNLNQVLDFSTQFIQDL